MCRRKITNVQKVPIPASVEIDIYYGVYTIQYTVYSILIII